MFTIAQSLSCLVFNDLFFDLLTMTYSFYLLNI